MSGRAESIGVRRIDKTSENLFDAEGRFAPLGNCDGAFGFVDFSAPVIKRDAKARVERDVAIVRDVNVNTIQTFIGHPYGLRRESAFEVPISRLRMSVRIENAPAGARFRIRAPEDNAAPATRFRPPPFSEDFRHHFAGNDAREFEVALDVGIAQDRRIDRVQQFQIVIADIFEIPARASIARDSLFPGWVPRRYVRRQILRFGNVREGKTLRGKADAGASHILEWPQIRSNSEVIRDARSRTKRLIALAWRRWDIGSARAALRDEGRQFSPEEIAPAKH